jgi:hypothetical protein
VEATSHISEIMLFLVNTANISLVSFLQNFAVTSPISQFHVGFIIHFIVLGSTAPPTLLLLLISLVFRYLIPHLVIVLEIK